jgi:U3 small nucleolar ribonucleoprotein component
MHSKFDELVRGLEQPMLEELRRSVAAELGGRRAQTAIQVEDIHPRMTGDAKTLAMQEIARVLRGEEESHA